MKRVVFATWVLLAACRSGPRMPHVAESGGDTTVFDATHDAFSLPAPGLSPRHRSSFFVGNSFFNQNWVAAPSSVDSRDGLGPLFNARSCSGCHFKDGRGRPPQGEEPLASLLIRVSVGNLRGLHGAPVGDPVYGDQLQGNGVPGVPKEAEVKIDYEEVAGVFPDGERYSLLKPKIRVEELGYGPLAPDVRLSARVAPAMIGLGLLEAVSDETLLALADADDRNGDGISGRPNRVPDLATGKLVVGRFGWKAEQPSVLQQIAAAFQGDLGLSTPLLEQQNDTLAQAAARAQPNGGVPEVSAQILREVAVYARVLAVPARREHLDANVAHGEELFGSVGCALCHTPTLRTQQAADLPELHAQDIHPYSDLLLHDLGQGLSDERPVYVASGNEWRTPPLWGIGLVEKVNGHTRFLHDGRARSLQEAILWHGGEATAARARFERLSASDRKSLLAFLRSL
ncbi:MAG TPA: di-heme oxidoredictase family protein [Polyangiaceae bacterium]|nr:di-heme oxidoredictase family protein [Polyangiaceae bacterium]